MSNSHLFQFRIPNLTMVSRASELFESEAHNAEDEGDAQLGARWREMSTACRQHVQGRRYRPRAIRPPQREMREDVLDAVMYGKAPYPALAYMEAREAARRMTSEGYSAARISNRVGVCERSVVRWRQWDREASTEEKNP